jgi:hypothetical protein
MPTANEIQGRNFQEAQDHVDAVREFFLSSGIEIMDSVTGTYKRYDHERKERVYTAKLASGEELEVLAGWCHYHSAVGSLNTMNGHLRTLKRIERHGDKKAIKRICEEIEGGYFFVMYYTEKAISGQY